MMTSACLAAASRRAPSSCASSAAARPSAPSARPVCATAAAALRGGKQGQAITPCCARPRVWVSMQVRQAALQLESPIHQRFRAPSEVAHPRRSEAGHGRHQCNVATHKYGCFVPPQRHSAGALLLPPPCCRSHASTASVQSHTCIRLANVTLFSSN